MSRRFPTQARAAAVKCVTCNAPGTQTVEKDYVCVTCGKTVLTSTQTRGDESGK